METGRKSVDSMISISWKIIVSVGLTMLLFMVGMVFIAAPLQAGDWIKLPFPGFVIEQTLLVGSYDGENWAFDGRIAKLQQVIRINDLLLKTPADFKDILSKFTLNDEISLTIMDEKGEISVFQHLPLMRFPQKDFLRLFWLPYWVGLIYLLLGVGVLLRRGNQPSGQAFAYFCFSIAISNVLLFDLISAHEWVDLWSIAISQLGGAAILLAFTFPEPLPQLRRYPWLAGIPLMLSLAFTVWGLRVNHDIINPWGYVYAWRGSFLYAVFGVLFFFMCLIYRLRNLPAPEEAQQIRVTLWGGFFAFTPALVWLASPLLGMELIWDPAIFLPLLMIFPVAIGAAIIRHRLWDIEVIINRTIVYSALTLILGGVFVLSILISQYFLMGLIQRPTVVSVAVSSVAITLLFNPVRVRIQDFVDQRFFRRKYDVTRAVVDFQTTVLDTIDYEVLEKGLISIICETMQPTKVVLYTCGPLNLNKYFYVDNEDPLRAILLTSQDLLFVDKLTFHSNALEQLRKENIVIIVSLVNQGELIGIITLGPKRSGQSYTPDDRYLLRILAAHVAPALKIASLFRLNEEKAVEQERFRQEMEVARLVQQALLPRDLPEIPSWEIAFHYQPARAVGGDFYDFFLRGEELVVIIGDVTDKGVPAALVMATTRSILRGTARRNLSPAAALELTNTLLIPEMFASMFVTCFYIVLNCRTGRVIYANAGHNPPKHRTKTGVAELYATGFPLGLMENVVYEEHEANIQCGDSVLLYSDGLVEAHNPANELFGNKRLEALLNQTPTPGKIIEELLLAVQNHSGRENDPEDDITLLTIHRKEAPDCQPEGKFSEQ